MFVTLLQLLVLHNKMYMYTKIANNLVLYALPSFNVFSVKISKSRERSWSKA